jgi:electron transfer flavoprotein alpha/beta subunit
VRAFALIHRPSDLAAVRAATKLGETTAVAALPALASASQLLGRARALEAVRAIRLWDDALDATDYLGVAIALAGVVRTLAPDPASLASTVIFCGEGGRGVVGPALAERLQLPHLGGVLGVSAVDDRLIVRRRDGAVVRLYAGSAPAVLCVVDPGPAGDEPSAPDDSEQWTLERCGLTPAEVSYRRRFRPRASAGPAAAPRKFADAHALAARLRGDGFVGHGEG